MSLVAKSSKCFFKKIKFPSQISSPSDDSLLSSYSGSGQMSFCVLLPTDILKSASQPLSHYRLLVIAEPIREWTNKLGWHHQLDGHEFEQALGVGDGQGGLACCSPRGHRESDTTEWLNWNKLGKWGLGFRNKVEAYLSKLRTKGQVMRGADTECPRPTHTHTHTPSCWSQSCFSLLQQISLAPITPYTQFWALKTQK